MRRCAAHTGSILPPIECRSPPFDVPRIPPLQVDTFVCLVRATDGKRKISTLVGVVCGVCDHANSQRAIGCMLLRYVSICLSICGIGFS